MNDLAPMREQVYSDPRPKEYFDRFHERARTREPDWAYELVARAHLAVRLHASCARGRSRSRTCRAAGAVILAPNHFSFMDHFLMGCYIRRKVRFMAKSQLFKGPMQFIYTHGGVFPVRRGARDEETFITAETILGTGRRDHDVLRGRALAHRQSGGAGQARHRAPRARDGRAGRADRDPRLLARPQLEAPAVPEGHDPVRRADPLGARSRTRRASSSRPSPTRSSLEIRRLYAGLEEHGRRGILRRLREQRRAAARAQGRGRRLSAAASAPSPRVRSIAEATEADADARRRRRDPPGLVDLRRPGAGADARRGGRVRVHRDPLRRCSLQRGAPALAVLALLISLIATTLFTGMVVELVADVQDGRRDASAGQLLRAVDARARPADRSSRSWPASCVVDRLRAPDRPRPDPAHGMVGGRAGRRARAAARACSALRRSRELVRGNGWQVFGVILVLDVLVAIVAGRARDGRRIGEAPALGIVVRVVARRADGAARRRSPPPSSTSSCCGGVASAAERAARRARRRPRPTRSGPAVTARRADERRARKLSGAPVRERLRAAAARACSTASAAGRDGRERRRRRSRTRRARGCSALRRGRVSRCALGSRHARREEEAVGRRRSTACSAELGRRRAARRRRRGAVRRAAPERRCSPACRRAGTLTRARRVRRDARRRAVGLAHS